MLAFARVAGETAPLLFTAFGNQFWNLRVRSAHGGIASADLLPTRFRPTTIGTGRHGPDALVLIILIVSAVAAVRYAVRRGTLAELA